MIELGLQYLPFGGFNVQVDMQHSQAFAELVAEWDDEQMFTYLKGNYDMSDRKARAFVSDSKFYRDCAKKIGEIFSEKIAEEEHGEKE